MHIEPGQIYENVANAHQAVLEAGNRGSDLVLLPELWSTGYDLQNSAHHARQNEELASEIASWCETQHLWLGGSVLKNTPTGIQNVFDLYSPSGNLVAQYPKIHLFGLMDENRYLAPGERPVIAHTPWGRTGLAICYDLRFPELFRVHSLSGCVLVLLTAEWPQKRIAHWQTLIKARAIENQLFVAAANCVGSGGGETFGGSSAVISPWGETCVGARENVEEVITATIDLEEVQRIRTAIPVLADRRPDAYTPFSQTESLPH